MSNYNWCHGPKCHEHRTQDRIRGVKGNKVLRTRKMQLIIGIKIVRGNGSVPQVVGISSSINMQINADRLRHAMSLRKHLLKFK